MRRRGGPPPWGFRDESFPPPPPPDYHNGYRGPPSPPWERRDHFGYPPSPPPPPDRPPRFRDDHPSGPPPPWLRDDFDGPPRPPPWKDDRPPPWKDDHPPPWKDDRPPPWHPTSFSDDDFDIPPPPPPYPPEGSPRGRGRGRGGDARGGNRGRGVPSGRGEAPSRGTSSPRGAPARGANNGRGAKPVRGSPRGTSRGSQSRGAPGNTRGTGMARGVPNGNSNATRGASGRGRGVRGAQNGRGGSTASAGRGTSNWFSATRGGNSGRGGATTTTTPTTTAGTAGNTNNNQATVKTENTPGTNVTKPNSQNVTANAVPKAGQANSADSYYDHYYKKQAAPKSTVVKAAVPGEPNFISFKNSLQECCQKQHLAVPSYTTWKNSFGYSGKVEVANNTYKSTGIQGERKEAEQSAAYTALINLGLIDSSVSFDVKTAAAVKRPFIDNSIVQDSSGKRVKLETTSPVATSYKSRLNEFCQKFRLSIPSYDTEKKENGKGFITTVVFNKKVYQSNGPQPTKKQAEQNAAQVVLHMLNQCPPPAPSFQDYIEQCRQLTSTQDEPTESNTAAGTTASTTTASTTTVQPSTTAAAVSTPSTPSVQRFSTPTVQKITTPAVPSSEPDTPAKPTTFTSHKNKLQEYCQKAKLGMPVYSSNRENGVFTCTVQVAGSAYTSNGCNTKKGSEQTAANVALKALGIV